MSICDAVNGTGRRSMEKSHLLQPIYFAMKAVIWKRPSEFWATSSTSQRVHCVLGEHLGNNFRSIRIRAVRASPRSRILSYNNGTRRFCDGNRA